MQWCNLLWGRRGENDCNISEIEVIVIICCAKYVVKGGCLCT